MFDWGFLHPYIKYILDNRKDYDDMQTLIMLEQYKFLPVSDLLKIGKKLSNRDVVYVNGIKCSNSFSQVQQKYDVLLEEVGMKFKLYVSIDNTVSPYALQLEVSSYELEIVYVLPCNFLMLKYPNDYEERYVWDYYVLFNRYIVECIEYKATDFHWGVAHVNKKVVYRSSMRIDSRLRRFDLFRITPDMNREMVRCLVADRTGALPIDLQSVSGITTSVKDVLGDGDIEIRVSCVKVVGGYKMVVRIQKVSTVSLKIPELGFDEEAQNALIQLTKKDDGLFIVTGAIRTGKNTTINAWANQVIADFGDSLAIQEYSDPVEVLMPFEGQLDYGGNVEALSNAIRLAKKQDIDIVILNEIPSKDVAFAVRDLVNSSLYVVTSMHVNRLWHFPHKLFEYLGDSFRDVLSQVNGIFNQRMYGRQCPNCLEEVTVEKYDNVGLQKFFKEQNIHSVVQSSGCSKCGGLGKITGKPVVLPEFIIFDNELVLNLFEAEKPYKMERILMEAVLGTSRCLEHQMAKAICDGRLSVEEVYSIL
jgi:type II secretory ATPase GspE/PulE/Tfp pilus assembly ATPase PilB-like protein